MIRIETTQPIPDTLRGAIIALGNFDGFHRGHQTVVGEAIRWARSERRPAIVATFDPHPMRLFVPDAAPFRLTTLDQRQDLFGAAGADAMLVIHFDASVAGMTAPEWIEASTLRVPTNAMSANTASSDVADSESTRGSGVRRSARARTSDSITAQTSQRACVRMRSGRSAAMAASRSVYSGSP